MDKEKTENILLAVMSTLDAIELRTDQVQKAAKIQACSKKLSEVLEALKEETANEGDNQ